MNYAFVAAVGLAAFFSSTAQAAVLTAHWTGAVNVQWSTPGNWDIGEVPDNNATDTFDVVWDAHPGTIRCDIAVTIRDLRISVDGVLTGDGNMTIEGSLVWHSGTIAGAGTTTVNGLATHDTGKINVQDRTIIFQQGLDIAGGELRLDGATLPSPSAVTIEAAAELSGYGFVHQASIAGALTPTARQLPSGDITWLRFDSLTLSPGAQTAFKITGSEPGTFDKFSVNSSLTLHGILQLTVDPAATIQPADHLEIITAAASAAVSGSFDNVAFGQRLLTADGTNSFLVTQIPPGSVVLTGYGAPNPPITLSMRSQLVYRFTPETTFLDPDAALSSQAGVSWNGGSLRVRFRGTFQAGDAVQIDDSTNGPFTLAIRSVRYHGAEFARLSDFSFDTDLMLAFEQGATSEIIQELLRSLWLDNIGVEPESPFDDRTIIVTLIDAAGDSVEQTITARFPALIGLAPEPDQLFIDLSADPHVDTSVSLAVRGKFSNDSLAPIEGAKLTAQADCVGLTIVESSESVFDVNGTNVTACVLTATYKGFSVDVPVVVQSGCIFDLLFFGLTGSLPPRDVVRRLDTASSAPSTLSLATFRALEGLMNQTQEGQRLTTLYRVHSQELVVMAVKNHSLAQAEADLVLSFQPAVTALLLAKTNQVVLTQQMIDQVNSIWDQIINLASPDLQNVMQTERTRLGGFQPFVSHPFSQWATLLEIPVPASPWIYISHPRRIGATFTLQANAIGSAEALFRSTNGLSDWQPVTGASQAATGDTIEFTDPAAPPGQVFYQIRSVAP